MAEQLALVGARFYAVHGVLPHERALAQPFSVDVRLWVERPEPADRDRVETTVDYRWIWEQVAAVMEGPPRALLETLAEAIAERLLVPAVTRAQVTVRKERPPLPGPVAACEAIVDRER
jgi:dihydroneopterin aldolase